MSTDEPIPSDRKSVHQALGGGSVADVLLWRKWDDGVRVIVYATTSWFLFVREDYNFVSFSANVLFYLIIILFFWMKAASLFNRPMPPISNLEVSEESIVKAVDGLKVGLIWGLTIATDVATDDDSKRLLQVIVCLLTVSYVGTFVHFFTLVYFGVLLSLVVPILYDKYQEIIDEKVCMIIRICVKIDRIIKILLRPPNKENKSN